MGWLDTHIDEFVLPQLKKFHSGRTDFNREPLGYFTQDEKTVIKNIWRATKKNAKGKPILLAGRDVFIFEVLARREDYPTTFIPECSRMTAKYLAEKIPNVKDYFLFDTGFVGSIPRALGIEDFTLLSFSRPFLSYQEIGNEEKIREYDNRNVRKQIFPRMSFSRGLALKIEVTPKYWESGRINHGFDVDDKPVDVILQPFSNEHEFINAARLTIEIYKDSSPKFVTKHQPISQERRW